MDTTSPKTTRPRMIVALMETFGLRLWAAVLVASLLALLGVAAIIWIVLSSPPRVITITSGPPGSSFQRNAERYKAELAKHGVELRILSSGGSLENLKRLQAPESGVDIGFVQGGLTEGVPPPNLVSLGSIAYQPLWLFYRGAPISRLSELASRRIAVGAVGSGTRALAMTLLLANGVTPQQATLVEDDAERASGGLIEGRLDAVFLMGDSAPTQVLRTLLRTPEVQLYDFTQADAYVRRYPYLNKTVLPQGSFDLGKNLPARNVTLLSPTVELVAKKGLHPALTDLVLGVAQGIHRRASLLQKQGEFPAPLEHEFTLSEDALRYYKSGKGVVYRLVGSFWVANLINRVLLALVPLILVLVPAMRVLPLIYRWSIQLRLYRCYRPLMLLERDAAGPLTKARGEELLARLDIVEQAVNRLRVPASFADQFYELRQHIVFVRRRIRLAMLSASSAH
ncbi:TAXI family TRAP transporter solute-binding subunit [Opitutus sp. ER46]|uniref:TAXI family TRAP transporter solute-binding subunit n=1 Tax=Opitutus sp. ER46 TaxID=2161864 RepID=UPI000D30BE3B|nr:TAXI family TRAP transporter solute-binding subunit [Opitutus sp. ER46]PTX94279.1 C4-dicarboxylate ABC transporter substrate-binding protein [Opitutus sp. ER46]